jgi:hypothetical protein
MHGATIKIQKHFVARCTKLASSEYNIGHNNVAGYIHWKACKRMGLQVTDRYCEHIQDRVINVNGTTGVWDLPVIPDRTVPANRLNAVLHDETEKTCLLIDIAIPDDSNFNTKGTEEQSKYKDQEIEVSRTWKVRTNTAPVIIGTLGTITKIRTFSCSQVTRRL